MNAMSPSPIRPPTHKHPFVDASGLGLGDGSDGKETLECIGKTQEICNGEVDENAEFDAEDIHPVKSLNTPDMPSRAAVEDHRVDHWPYRSWCDECNEGAGRERSHGAADPEHRASMIGMDYGYMTPKGPIVDEGEEGWDDPETLKILAVKEARRDGQHGAVFAHAVPNKGIDDKRFAVDMVVQDVLDLGHSKILMKSDNEPSIVKLLKESLAALKVSGMEQVNEEHPPPYDSQANGLAEAGVKQVKTKLRTMKLCLERRIGKRIPPRHPAIAWLVEHVGFLMRCRQRGADGKTSYERARGRPFNTRLLHFGERCRYKHRAKEPLDDDQRFHQGIFLGICRMSGQYMIYDSDRKVVKMARTVNLLPDHLKWDAANIESLTITPYDQHVAQDQGVAFQDRPAKATDADQPRPTQHARKLYIKAEDLRVYGYTIGCPRCDHERRYGPGRTTKGHSDACRERVINELLKTPEGQRRVQAAEDRAVRSTAEHLEEVLGPRTDQPPPVHGGKMPMWPMRRLFAFTILNRMNFDTTTSDHNTTNTTKTAFHLEKSRWKTPAFLRHR